MKKIWFMLLLFASATIQAQNKASVVIKMTPDKEISYWLSGADYLSDYEQSYARRETGKTDSMGYWQKEFIIDEPTTLNLAKVNKTIMSVLPLYLTPGSRDTITIRDGISCFGGTNAKYNRCMQETELFMNDCNRFLTGRPGKDALFQTKSYSVFKQLLDQRKTETEKKLKQYSELDTVFINEQFAHVDLVSRMAFLYKALGIPDSLYSKEWKRAAEEMVNKPIDTPYFPSFRETFFLLNGLLRMNEKTETGKIEGKCISLQSFEQLPKYMQGKNLECAWATLINDDIVYKSYDPVIPEMYDILKKHFPKNTYGAFLETGIQENHRFNEIKEDSNSNKDYQIIPCDTSFRSLADAIKSLKGKVVYVDLWATWCSSCLNEFSYLPQVEQKVNDLNVAFLYVSVDKPKDRIRWEKSIRHYKLKGYHLQATSGLAEAIYKEFGNYIPHAIIFDKNGNLTERNAPGLKQSEKLFEKLKEQSK